MIFHRKKSGKLKKDQNSQFCVGDQMEVNALPSINSPQTNRAPRFLSSSDRLMQEDRISEPLSHRKEFG